MGYSLIASFLRHNWSTLIPQWITMWNSSREVFVRVSPNAGPACHKHTKSPTTTDRTVSDNLKRSSFPKFVGITRDKRAPQGQPNRNLFKMFSIRYSLFDCEWYRPFFFSVLPDTRLLIYPCLAQETCSVHRVGDCRFPDSQDRSFSVFFARFSAVCRLLAWMT